MTIVVYRDGVMAADSLVTDHDLRCGAVRKIQKINGCLVGAAGGLAEVQMFFAWYAARAGTDRPVLTDDNFEGLVVMPGGQVNWYGHGLLPTRLDAPYHAIGSGFKVAMGALWMGASAERAVECAIALNIRCGGPIDVIRLDGDHND